MIRQPTILMTICALIVCAPVSGQSPSTSSAAKPTIVVFGAASLTNALQDLGDGFTKQSSVPIKFSFGASSALARQIESGAPADVFFSADLEWMNYLQSRGLIQPETRHEVIGNRLVLIAPAESAVQLKITPGFHLLAALGTTGRLATGDPDSVPVGRYAQAALTALGVWSEVSSRLVRADSVRSAMAFVDRGETPLGIVYETDALVDKKVRVLDVFPDTSHPPIVYPIAVTSSAKAEHGRVAADFIEYVRSPAGSLVFKSYGFKPLP